LAAIAAFRRGSSTAARTIAQAGQGFSNPVVSLSNHGDARAAVLRQAHVWTAPAVQEEFGVDAKWGASHVFGLLLRH